MSGRTDVEEKDFAGLATDGQNASETSPDFISDNRDGADFKKRAKAERDAVPGLSRELSAEARSDFDKMVEVTEECGKKEVWKYKMWIGLAGFLAALFLFVFLWNSAVKFLQREPEPEPEPEIITESTLKEIISVSELSTFKAVYNGIASVKSGGSKEPDYYVSYDATVDAGMDFEKVEFRVDNDEKKITVVMPEVYITDVNVDISSMDYIFVNESANASSVSQEAFKACEDDVKNESENQEAIFDLAAQNAENILTALIKPIIEQLDSEYSIRIVKGAEM